MNALTHGGNPKDVVGSRKAPTAALSRRVIHELGLALLEGECKYWRHNYRASKILAMVYIEAHDRHVSAWVEGQDEDPDTCEKGDDGEPIEGTGISHLVKAMACLAIVRDAQLYGTLIDDRPPAQADPKWIEKLNAKAAKIIDRCAEYQRGQYTEGNREEWPSFNEALSKGPVRVLGRKPVVHEVRTADGLPVPFVKVDVHETGTLMAGDAWAQKGAAAYVVSRPRTDIKFNMIEDCTCAMCRPEVVAFKSFTPAEFDRALSNYAAKLGAEDAGTALPELPKYVKENF